MGIALFLALGVLMAISCNEETNGIQIPLTFRLGGEANGLSEGKKVKCECDQMGELSASYKIKNDTVIYEGSMGGSFSRTVLNDDENGISLAPDTYGEIIVKLHKDSVWILTPVNFNTGSRFYENLAAFKGVKKDGQIFGQWNCAPFDIFEGGWVDTVGTVSGSWYIEDSP
ncbi:MAG: hypothetical protein ABJH72_13575 [Reichenbachiella sp.]|uniref:hypothetical protein n=1 Tax=Reichenbachiella sp. TaxID=2184521 RepID=UPI0032672C38